MQKRTIEQWINIGKKNCKSYVFYQDKVLDLSQFVLEHPGGVKAIKNYVYKNVTNIIFQVYPHTKNNTLKKLMSYHVGCIPESQVKSAKNKAEKSVSHNGEKPKQKKKVCFNSDNQKSMKSSTTTKSKSKRNRPLSKSLSKGKQDMRESTNKASPSKKNKSLSKNQKKQFITSIRVINQDQKRERPKLDDYFKQNRQNQRIKAQNLRRTKQKGGSCSFVNNELDQQKPNFRVPVLTVKRMNRNS